MAFPAPGLSDAWNRRKPLYRGLRTAGVKPATSPVTAGEPDVQELHRFHVSVLRQLVRTVPAYRAVLALRDDIRRGHVRRRLRRGHRIGHRTGTGAWRSAAEASRGADGGDARRL